MKYDIHFMLLDSANMTCNFP